MLTILENNSKSKSCPWDFGIDHLDADVVGDGMV